MAAKRELQDAGRTLIKSGAIYFRTLAANGTPSTSEARPSDWADIMEICFDNREADVGRFLRRHFAGLDISSLIRLAEPAPPVPTLCDRAVEVLNKGVVAFNDSIKMRNLSPAEERMLSYGFWSIGLVIDPPRLDALPSQDFLATIGSSNPSYTGWPPWMDARLFADPESRPKVLSGAFEFLVISSVSDFSSHVDFARLDPKGEFFLHRLLQDDGVASRVAPGKVMDPQLMIYRVAEVLAVGIAFAKALGWVPDQTQLGFAFRWQGLKGRTLTTWANPFSDLGNVYAGKAHDQAVESCVQFSLDTPLSALSQFVNAATKRLFATFDGSTIPLRTVDDLVNRVFARRLA